MIGAEAWLRSAGRVVVWCAAGLLGLVLLVVTLAHPAAPRPGQPVQLSRAQYCGPVPSYSPGARRGARPDGC